MKMDSKIWFGLCFFFCIFNLKYLIDDFYSINYVAVQQGDEFFDNYTNYLSCILFKDIKSGDLLFKDKTFKPDPADITTFINHTIASIEHRLNVSKFLSLESGFIFVYKVCFLIEKHFVHDDVENFDRLLSQYQVFFYIYSDGKLPFAYESLWRKNDNEKNFHLRIEKKKIYGRKSLQSNCSIPEKQLSHDYAVCLYKCFKKTNDSAYNFYRFDEKGLKLDLNFVVGKKNISAINKEHRKEYKICFKKCKNDNCFLETYESITIREEYWKNNTEKIRKRLDMDYQIYRPFYSTSYFYLQFIGLVCLFTSTSVCSTVPGLISFLAIRNRLIYNRHYRKFFPKLKYALIIFGLIYFLKETIKMYDDYKSKCESPFKSKTVYFRNVDDEYSIVTCFPIQLLIHNETDIKEGKGNDSSILNNNTFDELENKTNLFKDKIIDAYLNFGLKKIHLEWSINKKVLFKNDSFYGKPMFMRCFKIDIEINEPRYRLVIPIYTLTIDFKTDIWKAYLIEKFKSITSNMVNFDGEFKVRIINSSFSATSKTICSNYSQEKKVLGCSTNKNCVDKCINELFLKNHSSFTTNSVSDKDEFKVYLRNKLKFNQTKDPDVERTCLKKFEKPDCVSVIYEEALSVIYKIPNHNQLTLEILNFETVITKDLEQSIEKTILNILNLESIIFGSNATSLLLTLFYSLKKLFRLKWYRIYRVIIFLICFTAFKEIAEQDLIINGFYEQIDKIQFPDLVFCFDFKENDIDDNYKLTGNYLNKLTKNLTKKTVFENVKLFEEKEIWTKRPKANASYEIKEFYFLDLKCFEIEINAIIKIEDIYVFQRKMFIGVYFKKGLLEKRKEVYFGFKKPRSRHLFSFSSYQIGNLSDNVRLAKYVIKLESMSIKREDKFETLKNLKSLFYEKIFLNDVNGYLNRMNKKFQNIFVGSTTKEIILDEEEYRLDIEDENFDQFYQQLQKFDDQYYPYSLNYENEHFLYYTHSNFKNAGEKNKDADFCFTFSFLKRRVEITNDDNWPKLLQSVLNTFSLWLNLDILQMSFYINKFFQIFGLLYKFLIRLRRSLEPLLL